MLKLIPQEQPDSRKRKTRKKDGKKSASSKKKSIPKKFPPKFMEDPSKNLPKSKESIIELTGKKLIHYSMSPDTHTDQELAQMIYDMHRANLHLQRVRQRKRGNKRKKDK